MANTNLINHRQVFVEEYVRSGDHLEAAKKAGYKDTHTLRNQACKLRRECADEITEELHRNFAEIAPRALNILSDLAENAESESVRLGTFSQVSIPSLVLISRNVQAKHKIHSPSPSSLIHTNPSK